MELTYEKKVEALINYFKTGETEPVNFKLGLEIEHFLLEKESLKAVPYLGEKGIEGFLNELLKDGWEPVYEGNYLLGLKGDNADITLEPGGQFELSLYPFKDIKKIKEVYNDFLKQAYPILEDRGQQLFNLGYQPVSSIKEIELLPKKRYHYMYDYFKAKGKYAHNMMKGTSSIQLNLDYSNEEDLRKKVRVAYFLAPLIYHFFDNSPFFEGKKNYRNSIRSIIWGNCDNDRCGTIPNIFTDNFSYRDYANYILNIPAIVILKNNQLIYTGEKLIKDIEKIDFYDHNEINHLLTMVFPDVRIKKYLEIRVGDSLPYPYNMSYVVFWKGLIYNSANLNKLYDRAINYNESAMNYLRQDININGIKAKSYRKPLAEFFHELIDMAAVVLKKDEREYLDILKYLLIKETTLKNKTVKEFERTNNLKDALKWCQAGGGNTFDR